MGTMTPAEVIDHLTYCNYRHNRRLRPDIEPERWALIYPNAAAMEARYQAERPRECDVCGGAVSPWLEYQVVDPDTYGCECE